MFPDPGASRHHRPSRLRAICTRRDDVRAGGAFEGVFGLAPSHVLESPGWVVELHVDDPTRVADDPLGRVSIVVHGELYGDGAIEPSALAARFPDEGDRLPRDLIGSFALLILDRVADRVILVPDRTSSRSLYWSRDAQAHVITSRFADHPRGSRRADPVAAGWHLVSNFLPGGRTPLEGVRILEGRHVHTLTDTGVASSPYWERRPGSVDGPTDEGTLVERMGTLMVRAVGRRVHPDRDLFISLSGGPDSVSIAAILRACLGVDGVRALSYVDDDPRPGVDAWVAAETAAALGYPHHAVRSFEGGFLDVARVTAGLSEGIGPSLESSSGFREMGRLMAEGRAPLIFTGDQQFGPSAPGALTDLDRVLFKVGFRDFSLPDGVRGTLPRPLRRRIEEGMQSDRRALLGRVPAADDLPELKDHLNAEGRQPYVHMPWREGYLGRWAVVANPWLDADVLDFTTSLPAEWRRDKRLMNRTLLALWPAYERWRRADVEGYRPDLRAAARDEAPRLRRWAQSTRSLLDDVIPVTFGLALIDACARWSPGAARRRTLRRRATDRWRALTGRRPRWVASPEKLLFRWIVLRTVLEEPAG